MLTSAINQKFRMTTAWGAVGLRPRCLPGLYELMFPLQPACTYGRPDSQHTCVWLF